MTHPYISFHVWAFTRDFLEKYYLIRCGWLVRLGASLPKLLLSSVCGCHRSVN